MSRYLTAMLVACLLAVPFNQAQAYTIFSPGALVLGKPIADWTADWWTWGAQAPNGSTNPRFDPTGAFANYNNNGPVFFIGGGTFTRSFTVPAGRPLLLPLINFFDVEPDPPVTAPLSDRIAAANDAVDAWLTAVDTGSLFAFVDGNTVANTADYLEVTGIFSMGPVQPDSYLNDGFGTDVIPTGTDAFPTKAAGYWLMIGDLSLGTHELHFGGSAGPCCGLDAYSTDTTAFITVIASEPAMLFPLLPGAIALLELHRRRRRVTSQRCGLVLGADAALQLTPWRR